MGMQVTIGVMPSCCVWEGWGEGQRLCNSAQQEAAQTHFLTPGTRGKASSAAQSRREAPRQLWRHNCDSDTVPGREAGRPASLAEAPPY